jgi:hypothetical protein
MIEFADIANILALHAVLRCDGADRN